MTGVPALPNPRFSYNHAKPQSTSCGLFIAYHRDRTVPNGFKRPLSEHVNFQSKTKFLDCSS